MQLDAGIVIVTSLSPLFLALLSETYQAEPVPVEPCCRVTFCYRLPSVRTVSRLPSSSYMVLRPYLGDNRRSAETFHLARRCDVHLSVALSLFSATQDMTLGSTMFACSYARIACRSRSYRTSGKATKKKEVERVCDRYSRPSCDLRTGANEDTSREAHHRFPSHQ